MPGQNHKSPKNWTAEERLVAEQAILLHRQVTEAMQNALFGRAGCVVRAGALGTSVGQ